MIRKNRWIFAVLVLLGASLACSLVGGAKKSPTDEPSEQTTSPSMVTEAVSTEDSGSGGEAVPTWTAVPADQSGGGTQKYDTEFPLPEDASQFTDMGNKSINFQTGLSIKDALAFYRDAFEKAGYKERTINTSTTDTTFSVVFDGHSSGKAIVVQAVDLGGGKTNINIRFDDV